MIKVNRLLQAVFFVEDIERTAAAYARLLGIGPWDHFHWKAPLAYDMKNHGRDVTAYERLAFAGVGTTELELIQHVDGDSFYPDHMAAQGEGIMQLDFASSDVAADQQELEAKGFVCVQSGRFGDTGAYAILDTQPLHVLWEAARMADEFGVEPDSMAPMPAGRPSKLQIRELHELGIVTPDAEQCAGAHARILGIEGWRTRTVEGRANHRGTPVDVQATACTADLDGLTLSLLQPRSAAGVLAESLRARGPGVRYLGARVDDLDAVVGELTQAGMELVQAEETGDARAAYLWHPDLAVLWRFTATRGTASAEGRT